MGVVSSNLLLDMYTKIAHVAFHRSMKEAGLWLNLIQPNQAGVQVSSSPPGCQDAPYPMDEKVAADCGVSLAEWCLAKGYVQFSEMEAPKAGTDFCLSTGEGSSIRGLAQYRIIYDDYIYRFDMMGYTK